MKRYLKANLLSLIITMGLAYYFESSTSNILNIVIYIISLSYFIYYRARVTSESITLYQKIILMFGAIIFALICSAGKIGKSDRNIIDSLSIYSETINKNEVYLNNNFHGFGGLSWIYMLILFLGMTLFFYELFLFLYKQLSGYNDKNKNSNSFILNKWNNFFVLLILWTPYYVLNYPGITTYDSIDHICQAVGVNPISSFHSPFFSYFIRAIYKITNIFFLDNNTCVAVVSALQIVLLAYVIAEFISILAKKNFVASYILLLIYSIVPIFPMLSLIINSNVFYGIVLLGMCLQLYKMVEYSDMSKKTLVLIMLLELIALLIRQNGVIAILLSGIVICTCLRNKKYIIIFAIPILFFFVIVGPVYNALGVIDNNGIENALSVPIQQLSRTVIEHEQELSNEEIAAISEIVEVSKVEELYNCRLSDPMKRAVNGKIVKSNVAQFLGLWMKLGVKYPKSYIGAYIDLTLGFWYPDVQWEYGVFRYGTYPNTLGISTKYSMTGAYKIMKNICESFRIVPLLGNISSIGSNILVIIFFVLYCFFKKQYKKIIWIIPVLFTWSTLMLATPIFYGATYAYCIILSCPLFAVSVLGNE